MAALTYPRTVSVREKGSERLISFPLQFPPQLEVTSTPAQQTAVQAVSDTSSLPCVGREFEKGGSGGKEKKGETNLKPIPENLMQA